MTPGPLATRTALVTGAAQGMGRATALALAAAGASVAVNDRSTDHLTGLVEELTALGTGGRHLPVAADVSDARATTAMVAEVTGRLGPVTILVNSAGVLRGTKVPDISEDEWDHVLDVNLKGTFLVSQAVLPHMTSARWGRIVNFSSTAGKSVSTLGGAHYTASKAAVLGFTRHLASEVAGAGVTVNAVCPGLIDTAMVRHSVSAQAIAAYADSFPVGRLGTPDEVAALVAFLCSEQAAYITGASIDINGGDLMI